MTAKPIRQFLLCGALLVAGCGGSSTPGGSAGNGAAGTSGTGGTGSAGVTGTAGSGSAGATGAAGTGSAGTNAVGDAATDTAVTDAGTSDVAPSTDGATLTTNIKAATGGTVTAAGFTLEIPAGALAADTNITVSVSDGTGLPSASSLVASVYDLGPNGTTFAKPVKLTITTDAAKLGTKSPVVSYLAAGKWVALTDSVAGGGKVVATTTHFTSFGVLGADAAMCVALPKAECQTCCKTTFSKGASAPIGLAVQACGCAVGSPCATECAGNVCANMAPSAACQTCLNTAGSAQPQSACITKSQLDCANDVDCKAYTTCQVSCGSAPATDAGAADAQSDATSSDAAAACTVPFTDNAPVFAIKKVPTAAPAVTGGTIVPGTYWLTEQIDYTGVGGAESTAQGTYSETFQLTATEWNADITLQNMHYTLKTSYTISGTTFTPTRVCPTGNAIAALGYSVVGNTIRFQDLATGLSARVLVRQQ